MDNRHHQTLLIRNNDKVHTSTIDTTHGHEDNDCEDGGDALNENFEMSTSAAAFSLTRYVDCGGKVYSSTTSETSPPTKNACPVMARGNRTLALAGNTRTIHSLRYAKVGFMSLTVLSCTVVRKMQ